MLNNKTLTYIISFLTRHTLPDNTIGYTTNVSEFKKYKVVIVPSSFFNASVFGTEQSMPQFPLDRIKGIPILFGTTKIEKQAETLVVYADIIASTFFLISRYEETINPIRDNHGRFPASASVPFKGGFIHTPIVEEYGKLLRTWLRMVNVDITEPNAKFSEIYLTHDADKISQFRNFRGFAGGVIRKLKQPNSVKWQTMLKSAVCSVHFDPLYTFSWLFEQNNKVKHAKTIVFFKAGKSFLQADQPIYDLQSKEVKQLFELCEKNEVIIGLHTSYLAGEKPNLIAVEKKRLEKATYKKCNYSRYHYLRTCNTQDMQALIHAGITDDFTLGYADMAGFRLGTCRPVRWVNPKTKELTTLTLHPLTIMECSLSNTSYMNQNYDDALRYCKDLMASVKKHGGELVLLWHNTSVANYAEYAQLYHKTLYENLIKDLQE